MKAEEAVEAARRLLSRSKQLPMIFCDQFTHGYYRGGVSRHRMCLDFKETKKLVGELNSEVEPADICIFQKQEIKQNAKLFLERAKMLEHCDYERIVDRSYTFKIL